MDNKENLLKDLIGKDALKAQASADYLINNFDTELFKLLVDKSDFLFPFVRNNVANCIEKAVSKTNFQNILKFFVYYSPYYDDLFASILSKHANEELTDKIFDLLEKGSIEQKAYAAKYFSYIPDTIAIEDLNKYAFCDDEYLSSNAAEALGQMQDDVSFDIALENLSSNDDFDKLKAVKFFCSYGRNFPLKEIFIALKNTKMPENIAGQIPYMDNLLNLLESEYFEDALLTIFYIISGLGEILPLSDILHFDLKEVFLKLIQVNSNENDFSPFISLILLSALLKFSMFNENEEYVFDEDKNTKSEIMSIFKLLKNQNTEFWSQQKRFVLELLNSDDKNIIFTLPIIAEFKLKSSVPKLKQLIFSNNEIITCEVLNTLKALGELEGISLKEIASKIENPNIKAIIENMK